MGRRPNTDGLGLELAGTSTDERGQFVVGNPCHTRTEGMWTVGECNGRTAITHTSWNGHEIVVVTPGRPVSATHL